MRTAVAMGLLGLLSACGMPQDPVVIDPDLLEYSARFEQEIGVSSSGISMVFEELSDGAVGLCTVSASGRKISIDPNFWRSIDEDVREELMYHELGHCAMDLEHDESLMAGSRCPQSVMYPYVLGRCYSLNKTHYKQDLVGRK